MTRIKIFVCYSHADDVWVGNDQPYGLMPWLQNQLKRHHVDIWWDAGIHGGDEFKRLIFEKIDESQIAILLFSNNLAGSDFILDIELPRIRQRYDEKKLTILPILISPVSELTRDLLSWVLDIQMVPNDRKGLNAFVNSNEWPEIQTSVLNEIYRRVNALRVYEAAASSSPPTLHTQDQEDQNEINVSKPTEEHITEPMIQTAPIPPPPAAEPPPAAPPTPPLPTSPPAPEPVWEIPVQPQIPAASVNPETNPNIIPIVPTASELPRTNASSPLVNKQKTNSAHPLRMIGLTILFVSLVAYFAWRWTKQDNPTTLNGDLAYRKAEENDNLQREKAESAEAKRKADLEKARLSELKEIAEKEYQRGVQYSNGTGVDKDEAEAVKYFHKAADHGNTKAQLSLGSCYETGIGVTKNEEEAVKWYTKAADQRYAIAQYFLGHCYEKGIGVTKDEAEAVKWYAKAADQGYANAQYKLGVCYATGKSVMKDEAVAVNLYRKAADQGDANAQRSLGFCYENGSGVTKDEAEAVKWYTKAADQGDAIAQFTLGACYEFGKGVTKDEAEAVKWNTKAANHGYAFAQYALGTCYEFGTGVTKDKAEAVKWYRKAAAQGDADAKTRLKELSQ